MEEDLPAVGASDILKGKMIATLLCGMNYLGL